MPNTICWTQPATVLATALLSLTGRATGSYEQRPAFICPQVVEYTLKEQRRLAEKVDALTEVSASIDWFANHMVLVRQLRVCQYQIHVLF